MSNILMVVTTAIRRLSQEDSFGWWSSSYFIDWLIVGFLWLLSHLVSFLPVYERSFSPQDNLIALPHLKNQISSSLNFGLALYLPVILLLLAGIRKKSLLEIHHGILALCAGRGLARLVTEYLKHKVGRLRPDFLARCKWDGTATLCMGKSAAILEGRKSFPSGHSSTAFAGMTFMALWIAGQTAGLCPNISPSSTTLRSRMIAFVLTISPLFWATHVAVTRLEDNRHHKEDVIVGSLIGSASAIVCYLLYWPNPLKASSFRPSGVTIPRDMHNERRMTETYELAALEEGPLNAV